MTMQQIEISVLLWSKFRLYVNFIIRIRAIKSLRGFSTVQVNHSFLCITVRLFLWVGLHYMCLILVENECIPCKDLARSLQKTHALQDLARKFFSCKTLQGNVFLERSCKEMSSLQDS